MSMLGSQAHINLTASIQKKGVKPCVKEPCSISVGTCCFCREGAKHCHKQVLLDLCCAKVWAGNGAALLAVPGRRSRSASREELQV